MNKQQLLFRSGLLLGLASCVTSMSAQEPATSDDETIMLSPFVVQSDSHVGYLATSTLAGTRINSQLRDVAASISIATPEFLQDTAATNAEDLLVYITGSEAGGPGGNYSSLQPANNEGTLIVQAQLSAFGGPTRSRGLASFDNTRDYFLSAIPLDSYNSDGVVINRGPNAILFGLGSPAGIINNQLKKASFNDKNNVSLRYSSFDSYRQTFDINKEIVDDKLAIRLIGLYQKRNYEQEPAFARDRRIFGAFTFQDRLAKKSTFLNRTSVRGNFEIGKIDGNNPYVAPPVDEITNWFRLGKPSWNVVDDVWATRNTAVIDVLRPGAFRNPTAVYRDPSSSVADAGFAGVNAGARQFVVDNILTPGGVLRSPMVLAVPTRTGFSMSSAGNPLGRFTTSPSLTDRSVFDYRKNKLTGDYDREEGEVRAYNLTLEQVFFEDQSLGLELAYDDQSFDTKNRRLSSPIESALQVDINEVLTTGEPNPDYGRVFFTSIPTNGSSRWDAEAIRATAFYKFNFDEKFEDSWAKHLGRHVFTGHWNRQTTDWWGASGISYTSAGDYTTNYGGSANNYLTIGRMQWTSLHYVGDSILNANSLADVSGIQRLTAVQLPAGGMSTYAWNQTTRAFENKTFSFLQNSEDGGDLASSIGISRQKIDTIAGALQSFFFNQKLVSTLGWRQDAVKIYNAGDNFNSAFTSTPLAPRDTATGLIIRDNYFLPERPGFETTESVFSWGAVLHSPEWLEKRLPLGSSLSLHYNDSQNFQPTGVRYDSQLNVLGPVQGSTKEHGFTFSMFNGKLVSRVNWYKTSQENVGISVPNLGSVMTIASLTVKENTPEQLAAAGFKLPRQELMDFYNWTQSSTPNGNGGYDVTLTSRGTVTEVTNFEATGTEMELMYNPTRNWRIMFNATRQESVRAGSGRAMAQLIEEMLPIWGDGVGANEPGEVLYTNSTRTMTLRQDAERNVIDPFRAFTLQDDGSAKEIREWRWNLISTYEFERGSALSGFRVGGALRWQDKVAIGFPVEHNADVNDYIPLVASPYFGPTDFKADAWVGYKFSILGGKVGVDLQLNVRNVANEGDLVPVAANPDGKTVGYWIGEGRTFDLTASFSF